MSVQHKDLTGVQLHEPKGAATAAAGSVYVSDGAGSGSWTNPPVLGWYDYNDSATAGSPITLTADTWTTMTNDGAGGDTELSYALAGTTNLWNTGTNRFDFTTLDVGDVLIGRLDLSFITSSANTAASVRLVCAEGHANEYDIPLLSQQNFKSIGTHRVTIPVSMYIGNTPTKDNPCSVEALTDEGSTVTVNGWFITVMKR